MSEGFDLGQFLQDARAEGQSDSEGTFTIAQNKALDKLAQFSLPGEYDWVLKIVQAANLWDCPNLQVHQTRVATSFYFKPTEARFPSDSDIVGALRIGSLEADGPVHELCIALRALVDQAKLSFVLATRYSGELGEPIYSGDDVSALGDRERRRWANLTRDGLRLTVSHFRGRESFTGRYVPTFSRIARRHLAIADILLARAFCSPVPILLDGRDITNPFHHPRIGQNLYYRPLAIVIGDRIDADSLEVQSFPLHMAVSRLKRPEKLKVRDTPWCVVRTFESLALEEYRVASQHLANYSLHHLDDLQHRVFWVRHGVICHNQTLFRGSVATNVLMFLPAGDLRSDLTGLSIRLDTKASDRAEFHQKRVAASFDQIVARLELLTSETGADSQLAFQQTAEPVDIEKLEAGFSIFTAGLVSGESSVVLLSRQLHRVWRKLKALPFREELAKKWGVFVGQELKRVKVDLANERHDTQRDF